MRRVTPNGEGEEKYPHVDGAVVIKQNREEKLAPFPAIILLFHLKVKNTSLLTLRPLSD